MRVAGGGACGGRPANAIPGVHAVHLTVKALPDPPTVSSIPRSSVCSSAPPATRRSDRLGCRAPRSPATAPSQACQPRVAYELAPHGPVHARRPTPPLPPPACRCLRSTAGSPRPPRAAAPSFQTLPAANMDELDELIAFLDDSRPQVRQPAPRSAASIQVASAGGSCALCLSASSPHLPRCTPPTPARSSNTRRSWCRG